MDLKEEQKQEALVRMEKLKLAKSVIDEFNKDGRLYYSEDAGRMFRGILYWVDNNEDFVKLIKDFEEKYNGLVYHAQLSHGEDDYLSLFYVNAHKEEWPMDRVALRDNRQFVYVINLNCEYLSEFGEIGIERANGGVSRIY